MIRERKFIWRVWWTAFFVGNWKCGDAFSMTKNGFVEINGESLLVNNGSDGNHQIDDNNNSKVMHGIADDLLNKYTLEGALGACVSRPVRIKARWIRGQPDDLEVERRQHNVSDDANANNNNNQKLIHFQRHGQGYHNLLGDMFKEFQEIDIESSDPKRNPFVRDEVLDAPLTELGRQQCREAAMDNDKYKPQAVVTSSMQRAIQTAMLTLPNLLPEQQQPNHDHHLPWFVHEGCREHMGFLKCNQRRSLSDIRRDFPTLDYSQMQHVTEEDTAFKSYEWETPLEMSNRAYDFLVNFLRPLPQTEIFVVTHSAFLYNMCNTVLQFDSKYTNESFINNDDVHPWFKTSEIRTFSLTFVDDDQNDN